MRPRIGRRSCAGALLAAALAASSPASVAPAQTAVDPAASVLPILSDDAILPIDVRAAVVPLENVRTRGQRTRVTLAADVLFAFNKTTLTPAARRTVARIGRRLRNARGTVRVDGYTDSIGSNAYNLRLSERRARAVVAALRAATARGKRFAARGHGESDPVAPNVTGGKDNPAGRAMNRRVTISYRRG